MSTTTPPSQKRTDHPLDLLDYSEKTAKRASWEAYEFTITAPRTIQVTNASYGLMKDRHTYAVTVEEVDGAALPAECECPGDQHHEQACKHRVAVATKGGQTLLNAALNASPCLDGLPGCVGPDGDELPCFTCYTEQEKAAERDETNP